MKRIHTKRLAQHYTLPSHIKLSFCKGCIFCKLPNHKFPHSHIPTTHPLEIIHSDLYSPSHLSSQTKNLYFITFIHEYIRFTMVSFLRDKTSLIVVHHFKTYHKFIENHLELTFKTLESNFGGEYTSHVFEIYARLHGIGHWLNIPYNP